MAGFVNRPFVVLVVTFFLLWLAAWIGGRFGLRQDESSEGVRQDFGVIQSATLTLLGLIIGFTFSMAIGRYDQRKLYEEAEANAIGTEYVRADLLAPDEASKVRELLRKYTDLRVAVLHNARPGRTESDQFADDSNTKPALDHSFADGDRAAYAGPSTGRCRNERCIELARVHAGSMVEPHSGGSVVLDVRDCGARQSAGWVWSAQGEGEAFYDASAGSGHFVFSDCRYRQPETWGDPGAPAEHGESAGGVQYAAVVAWSRSRDRLGRWELIWKQSDGHSPATEEKTGWRPRQC